MKKDDVIKKNSWRMLIIVVLLILSSVLIIKGQYPYYKIEDKTKALKSFKGVEDEKALGWLRVQGTNIDFPIVYYYDTDVTDSTNELGWTYSNSNKLEEKTTIFSHNILNVSSRPLITDKNHKRFEQLMSFIYTDFVKKNKYIEYTTDNNNYLFKIYAISFQKEENLSYKKTDLASKEKQKYIDNAIKNSYFKFNTDVKNSDKLITLVTCTRFFGNTTDYSFVVDARLVRKNELVTNYGVEETKNYKKIKDIMKGDADNV